MSRLDIRSYRDTPKPGETDSKWCAYVVEPNGHIMKPGTTGHETELEARAAMGDIDAQERLRARTASQCVASAAPDLLAALEAIMNPPALPYACARSRREYLAATRAQARAAIAKAKGGAA